MNNDKKSTLSPFTPASVNKVHNDLSNQSIAQLQAYSTHRAHASTPSHLLPMQKQQEGPGQHKTFHQQMHQFHPQPSLGEQPPNMPQLQHSHLQLQPTASEQNQAPTLFSRFDASKSTKGASKLRRDLINTEIANLRDLLPLPPSTRQRLSQLQLMALVCVYVRKANYFQQVFKGLDKSVHQTPTPNIGFSKALSGFLMMLTQNGKLLYISDNAAEYLGHSMEDLLIHGDSVYDITDKQDHSAMQAELNRNIPPQPGQRANSSVENFSGLEGAHRIFLCRMNVSRNARRQMRFGDQKVVLVQGHYISFLPLCSRNEAVFLATCTPIAMPETRECVVQGATNVFTTIHSMDMKIAHIDKNGESHLGYQKVDIQGTSWYKLIHPEYLREAQSKHRLITQSDQDRSCILLLRLQRKQGDFIWVHAVLQIRDSQESDQESMIVCTNQVLSEGEASVMITNSWLYHYYTVQSKIQFGLPFEGPTRVPPSQDAAITGTTTFYHQQYNYNPQQSNTQESGLAYSMAMNPSLSHQQTNYSHSHQYYHHVSRYDTVYHTTSSGSKSLNQCLETLNDINTKGSKLEDNNFNNHGKRLCIEPVDYSSLSTAVSPSLSNSSVSTSEVRSSSSNSSIFSQKIIKNTNASHLYLSHNQQILPPSTKQSSTAKEEDPIFLENDDGSLAADVKNRTESNFYINNQYQSLSNRRGFVEARGSVVFATVVPTRPRHLAKGISLDPTDFIDQWNPSPPWSDSAQKTSSAESPSSVSHHELSPCVSTTPPTPTSAPLYGGLNNSHNHSFSNGSSQTLVPSFTFEWMSDQLMPPPQVEVAIPYLNTDGNSIIMTNRYQNHPRYALCPGSHHQQLTQHLAAHGHRLLTLSSSEVTEPVQSQHENERHLLNENVDGTLRFTIDKEIKRKIEEKDELFQKEVIRSTS